MRITNVISSLCDGGAERVLLMLSRLWTSRGHSVHVVVRTFNSGVGSRPRNFPDGVTLDCVIGSEVAWYWPPRSKSFGTLLALRRAILRSQPDAVVAFLDTVAVDCLLAVLGSSVPVIVAEHCDPNTRRFGEQTVSGSGPVSKSSLADRLKERLRMPLYSRAAAIVCLTETAMSFFPPHLRQRGRIIPNPVLPPPPLTEEQSVSHLDGSTARRLVSLGRLTHVKGLERLLSAFAIVAQKHPGWVLEVWGRGPEETRLRKLAVDLHIETQIRFCGWVDDPYAVLQGADIFAMSSYTEGFPMALCEAMACGVVPVSFDCPSGPRHIIRNGVDGLLIPDGDVEGLSAALDRLMSNTTERRQLAARAPEILARFEVGKILTMWDHLFASVCPGKAVVA